MADEDLNQESTADNKVQADADVLMDSDDLFDANGNLNTDAVAPKDGAQPGASKVELDLDDAPFLQEDQEEAPAAEAPEPPEEPALPAGEEAPKLSLIKRLLKRKKLVIGGGVGFLLIVGALVFLLLGDDEQPAPPVSEPEVTEPEELPPIEAKPGEVLISWEPFWVEYSDTDGETKFLVCQLSAPTLDPELKMEAELKTLVIRDAIYYYLSHKPITFLSEQRNADALKEDLLGVVNGYLTRGQLTSIYIESYLIR